MMPVLFGLFHFSYPPPWCSWERALMLMPVWLGVIAVYYVTLSLLAAAFFDTGMALIGFIGGGLRIPGSAGQALALCAVSLAAARISCAAGARSTASQ